MEKASSINEIAALSGVSPTTVSRVFSGSARVSARTRDVVMGIAKERGYQPRHYRRRVSTSVHDAAVGIIVPDIENPFFHQIIRAIIEELGQHGIELVICDTNELPNREIRYLSLLKQFSVNGIIIAPTSENAE